MPLTVLVTGANGFVGSALCPALERAGHAVRRAVRQSSIPSQPNTIAVGDIGSATQWSQALDGIDVVVHLAGRAHVMQESMTADAVRAAYFETNADGTEALARAAAARGVKRLVFVSSIKVNGEATFDTPYRESDEPHPEDDYGRSKLAAEQRLAQISRQTPLEHVIVRPPLIYGPGVKGNLARLMRIVDRGIPLPLGCIDNRRSLVGLTNLASALTLCCEHPDAAGRTLLVSDGRDLSTPDLIGLIAVGLDRKPRLLPVPASWLRALARVTGSGALTRLTGSLQVDSHALREGLGWHPPASIEAEIERMTSSYRDCPSA